MPPSGFHVWPSSSDLNTPSLLANNVRKVLITTIHKFGEAGGRLNERPNIIVMVDEAHRTQEGDLGRKMREALPNAFLFGLTGTPINRADRNTFWAFGADEDPKGYMNRYSFQESIRDKATLPLHFEAPEVRLKIDKAAIDEAYKQINGSLSEQDRDDLAKRAAKMAVLVKNPERVRAVVNHIVKCWLGLRFGLSGSVRSKDVLGHGSYPLRANSIFFLPSSTYPLSMTFGMMYVPSRRS
jgi:type I site-specific restriction-modification system R (restriction) subunit